MAKKICGSEEICINPIPDDCMECLKEQRDDSMAEIERLKEKYLDAVSNCYAFADRLVKAKLIDPVYRTRWKNEYRSLTEDKP